MRVMVVPTAAEQAQAALRQSAMSAQADKTDLSKVGSVVELRDVVEKLRARVEWLEARHEHAGRS